MKNFLVATSIMLAFISVALCVFASDRDAPAEKRIKKIRWAIVPGVLSIAILLACIWASK